MKNITLAIFCCLLFSLTAGAQQRINDNEQIKSMRIAMITSELQLTTEESQNFWPLYNEYEEKQKGIRQKYRPQKQLIQMTDAELEEQLSNNLKMEQELLQLKGTYMEKMKAVLPIRKVARIPAAETKFKRAILKEAQLRQGNRRKRLGGND